MNSALIYYYDGLIKGTNEEFIRNKTRELIADVELPNDWWILFKTHHNETGAIELLIINFYNDNYTSYYQPTISLIFDPDTQITDCIARLDVFELRTYNPTPQTLNKFLVNFDKLYCILKEV